MLANGNKTVFWFFRQDNVEYMFYKVFCVFLVSYSLLVSITYTYSCLDILHQTYIHYTVTKALIVKLLSPPQHSVREPQLGRLGFV